MEVATVSQPELATVYFDINDLTGGAKSTNGLVTHLLGPERQNPLTVANLNLAETQVKGTGGTHAATDLYLKFQPADVDDLRELEEADLFLLDFPWTRELIEKGDYYQSGKDTTDYPDLYTTISIHAPIPDVPYVVLASLDLSQSNPKILKKAFEITGNGQEFDDTYGPIENKTKICLENRDDWTVLVCDDGGGGGGGGSSQFITNECGCEIFANQRKPGGTIKVEDTQFNKDFPVRRVRVVAKNGWFSWRRADTDDNGCWRVDREFSGKAWFWVKFKDKVSNRGKIRFSGVRGWRVWQKALTGSVYLGRVNGPNFHNILTRFGRWSNVNGTKVHYAWAGATVNNAIHEFHDLSATEGFFAPPLNINFMVNLGRRRGFATMMRQMGTTNFISAIANGLALGNLHELGFSSESEIGMSFLESMGTIDWPISSPLLNTFLGDVNIGGRFGLSDSLKRLAFHEIGHSSHFQGTSIDFYRDVVISPQVANSGHGNLNSVSAENISLVESWVEHISRTMLIRTYPRPASMNSDAFQNWSTDLENVANESLNHIPIGIYNDLIDPVNLSESVYDEDERQCSFSTGAVFIPISAFETLIDPVNGGYTNAFFAQTLNSTVRSPDDFREKCLLDLPAGVSAANVNQLFQEYE